jgi:phosphohistidine phosphatase SixA
VPRPGCVLTSPLLRTRETAALLTQSAGWPAASSCKPLAPGTAPEEFLAFLRRNATARIAAVGHEPGLSELLSVCLYGGAAHGAFGFKKMGAALVTFGGTVSAGRGRLVWFLPPRLLRAAR